MVAVRWVLILRSEFDFKQYIECIRAELTWLVFLLGVGGNTCLVAFGLRVSTCCPLSVGIVLAAHCVPNRICPSLNLTLTVLTQLQLLRRRYELKTLSELTSTELDVI